MSKYANLGKQLADQMTASNIPEVLFTDNADLRKTIRHLANISVSDVVSTPEEMIASVEEYASMENEHETFSFEFNNFEAIADAFANKLKSGIDQLHSVKETVKRLVDEYQEKTAMKIASDPVLAKVNGIETELTMDDVTWKYLDNVDEMGLRDLCHSAAGFSSSINITSTVVDGVINQLPGANNYNRVNIQSIHLDQTKFIEIVNKLHDAMPDESIDSIAGMFRNILNLDTNCTRVAVNSARNFAQGKTVSNINHIMKNAVAYKNLLPLLTNDVMDLAASTIAELELHKEVMEAIANVNLYIAFYYRNVVWKDAILVPGPMCNPDNAEEYTKNGGTTTKLVQHHTKFYRDVKVPTKGISSAFVLKNAEQLDKEFSTEALKHAAQINQATNEIKRASFIVVTSNYLNANKKELSPKFANINNVEKFATSIYDGAPDAAIEEKFYNAIFKSQYIGTIVPVLYDRIGKAYSEYVKTTGSITKESCENLDVGVYADMISEYLVNQGVLVV